MTATWTQPAPGRSFVEHREVLTRLPETPTGRPPILFVHGATQGAWSWDRYWMPVAAEQGWACHAVSLRGHGASRGGPHTATISDYVEDVMQVIVRLPCPPVLVGHSMGSLIVQRILATYPAPAGVLVTPLGLRHGLRTGLSVARRHPLDFLGGLAGRPVPARSDYQFIERQGEEAERLVAESVPESPLAQYAILLPRRARPARAPVLVLASGADALVPVIDVVRVARHYGTRAHVFLGMGHGLMLERRWHQPLQVMLDWLDGVVGDHDGDRQQIA